MTLNTPFIRREAYANQPDAFMRSHQEYMLGGMDKGIPTAQAKYPLLCDYMREIDILDDNYHRVAVRFAGIYNVATAPLQAACGRYEEYIGRGLPPPVTEQTDDDENKLPVDIYHAVIKALTPRQFSLAVMSSTEHIAKLSLNEKAALSGMLFRLAAEIERAFMEIEKVFFCLEAEKNA